MTEVLDRPRPSLVRAEVRRLSSRRFVRVLLLLGVLGLLAVVGMASATSFARTTPERLAAAQVTVDEIVQEQNSFREQCLRDPPLRDPSLPAEGPGEQQCPPASTGEEYRAEEFLDKQPFLLAEGLPGGAVAVAGAVAALSYVLGATSIGAEWSSRSMVALLFWESRRSRVMAAKLAVLAGAVVGVSVVAQLLWSVSAYVMAANLGSTGPLPDGFLGDVLGVQARSALLAVLVAFLGFAVTNLARNTGAALGVGFVYFAIVENAIRTIRPTWQPYLLAENAAALVFKGGQTIFVSTGGSVDSSGQYTDTPREVLLSNLHGGLVLGVITAVLVGIGVAVFARRDLA